MKYFKRKYLRILNKILIVLAIILLLLLLFGFVNDLLDKMDILIKYTDQQASHIHNLQQEVHSLEAANVKLENVITYQHQQIQELKVSGNTMTFTMQPKEVTMEDLHNEIEPQLHKEPSFTPQTIIISLLTGLKMIQGTVGLFMPTLP